MSTFGGPGGRQIISKPVPPERGSFPLDHDAECQPLMKEYLKCLRSTRGVNEDACRELSKKYLQCRMDRNLMAPDSMKNLGYQDLDKTPATVDKPESSVNAGKGR
ncbi:cytochrome c oxidase assembly protein COX19 [Neohortaea acidophila]|uniref:Cytochrome c oxidase assembly protein COX19 n=1 Tax=Neohortaea acidophila TaxID=245834 RepID=A0A6A6PZ21_9PEZI|nr:cytochrome c oxidase assembly protein COX19 [Neohortaea acidophila]KAF2484437.1 cytochrome c oxidase assembly protein COX19 [Neohortaea acidophila]